MESSNVDGELTTVDPRVASWEYEYDFIADFDKTKVNDGGNLSGNMFQRKSNIGWVNNSCCYLNVKTGEPHIWHVGYVKIELV